MIREVCMIHSLFPTSDFYRSTLGVSDSCLGWIGDNYLNRIVEHGGGAVVGFWKRFGRG
jgi:hypothetical protein